MMSFYDYFVGKWKLTNLDNSEEGSLVITLSACGTAHLAEYALGRTKRTELWGYDPVSKTWCATGFGQDGECFTQTMIGAPDKEEPEAGDAWIDEHRGMLPDGTPTSADIRLEIESPDTYLAIVPQIKAGELSFPGLKMRCSRV
ncbi:MAG: hypothetical protein AAGA45_04220 [Verrucomicrobiota bacterium]